MKILVTGAAGFIGYHVCKWLVKNDHEIYGIDNINSYYDVNIKYGRLSDLGLDITKIDYKERIYSKTNKNFIFIKLDLKDAENLLQLFQNSSFDLVIHLAAQAGVRYSLINPFAYIDSNIYGFLNILESCRHHPVNHLVYASSSSVYGMNKKMPFSTHHNVGHPVSLYAASKKSNELMAHAYSHLYGVPTTGLRFFTVYGPWGRPDMAIFIFTKAILENKPIDIFNNGNMQRDFTYVDDIVEGILKVAIKVPEGNKKWSGEDPDPASSPAPFNLYNIGNNHPVHLLDFITAIEKKLNKKAKKNFLPLQPGDVTATYADVSDLVSKIGYKPATSIEDGINKFINWYKDYYNIS